MEYLIFSSDEGNVGLCSGLEPVSWSARGQPGIGLRYVAALQAFKSGKHDSLAEPWQFFETGGVCRLTGGFPYGDRNWPAEIGVIYWTRVPDGVVPSPDRPQHKAGFTEMYIWVPEREDLTDHPLKITVNDRNYSGRWEEVPHTTGRFFIDSGEVPALIAELAGASALKMMLVHPKQGGLRMEASLLNAGNSVEKMLACFRKN